MPDYKMTVTTSVLDSESRDAGRQITIERLVRAKNEARAVAHVVADTVKVERASVDDVVRLTKAGVELETAA